MNNEKKTEIFIVPLDILLDIVQILLQADIKHTIEGIKRARQAIVMELELDRSHAASKHNIVELIKDYNFCRYNEND